VNNFPSLALLVLVSVACGSTATGTETSIEPDVAFVSEASVADAGQPLEASVPDSNVQPDAGQDAATDSSDSSVGEDVAADVPLPLGEPIVSLVIPTDTALRVGENRIQWTMASTGTPIVVKKAIVGLWVHPYNEDAGMVSWNWRSRWSWDSAAIRLRRNGVVLDPSQYELVVWVFPMSPGGRVMSFHVVFSTEEQVTNTAATYELSLPVTGELTTGDAIDVTIQTGVVGSGNVPGRLMPTRSGGGAYHVPGPHIWNGPPGICVLPTSTATIGEYTRQSDFVWSRPGPGHTYTDCTDATASSDWFPRAATPTTQSYRLTAP
jgi:hypothetical protein